MDELKEGERTHHWDVWNEDRNHHGFQSKPTLERWPPHWEVTDRKIRAYFGVVEMLEMMKEQREENFERDSIGDGGNRFRDSHCDADSHIQGSGHGQMHGGLQTRRADPERNLEIDGDDRRNDGALDGTGPRLDVCGSSQRCGFCNRSEVSVRNEGCRRRDEVVARERKHQEKNPACKGKNHARWKLKECRDKIKTRNTPQIRKTREVERIDERTLVETGGAAGGGGERYPTWAHDGCFSLTETASRNAYAVAEPV